MDPNREIEMVIYPMGTIRKNHLKQIQNQLVVSTHLKNVSQNGNLPQVGGKIKNI